MPLALQLLDRFFLAEDSLSYSLPSNPKTLMADFYLCSFLLKRLGTRAELRKSGHDTDAPENEQEYSHETEATFEAAEAAASKLFPHLKRQLEHDVLFSICAEIRHLKDLTQDYNLHPGEWRTASVRDNNDEPYHDIKVWYNFSPADRRFMRAYFKNYTLQTSSYSLKRRDKDTTYKGEKGEYLASLKATTAAMHDTGMPLPEVVKLYEKLFMNGSWSSRYGGYKWARIADGWLQLHSAPETDIYKLGSLIDHIYDLEHNTGTVFNKLKDYNLKGYDWIKQALDLKRDARNPRRLLDMDASSDMRRIALRGLHALGIAIPAPNPATKPVAASTYKPKGVTPTVVPAAVMPPIRSSTGDSYSGEWNGGIWKDGTFQSGVWKAGIWEKGTWIHGMWSGGVWKDGTWKDGTFEHGVWENGTWNSGTFKGNSVWKNGVWNYGAFMAPAVWEGGTWEDGIWFSGEWKGGEWVKGKYKNPVTKRWEISTLSPPEFFAAAQVAAAWSTCSTKLDAPVTPPSAPTPVTGVYGAGDVLPKTESTARSHLDALCESMLLTESPRLPTLKAHRVKLTTGERNAVVNAGAVWHHGENGARTPAIWKSIVLGKPWYVCSTHRAFQCRPTLRGALGTYRAIAATA